ncbi:MAG: hypothetical protein ACLFM8_01165 [Halobacteriales archaeon]
MATGQSTTREGAVLEAIASADHLCVLARPWPDELAAAAVLAGAAEGSVHVRVVDGHRGPPETPAGTTLATDPGVDAADAALEGADPLAAALSVADALDATVPPSIDALATAAEAAPGVVAVEDDLGASVATSLRYHGPVSGRDPATVAERLDRATLPTTLEGVRADPTGARRLVGWLATATLEGEARPASATAALERAVAPTYLDGHRVPTLEGLNDVLAVLAWADPGLGLGVLLGGDDWSTALARYRDVAPRVHAAVAGLPTDGAGDLVVGTVEDVPPAPTAWLWSAYRLHRPYGLVVADEAPTRVALASTGARSASALLEGLVAEVGGGFWGDRRVAGAHLPVPADGVARRLEGAL